MCLPSCREGGEIDCAPLARNANAAIERVRTFKMSWLVGVAAIGKMIVFVSGSGTSSELRRVKLRLSLLTL